MPSLLEEAFILSCVLLSETLSCKAQVLQIMDTNPLHFLTLALPLCSANSYNVFITHTHTHTHTQEM